MDAITNVDELEAEMQTVRSMRDILHILARHPDADMRTRALLTLWMPEPREWQERDEDDFGRWFTATLEACDAEFRRRLVLRFIEDAEETHSPDVRWLEPMPLP